VTVVTHKEDVMPLVACRFVEKAKLTSIDTSSSNNPIIIVVILSDSCICDARAMSQELSSHFCIIHHSFIHGDGG
jgi:hypothetical protein